MNAHAKAIYLADRNPRLTHGQFADRWLEHNRVTTGLCGRVMRRETAAVRYCLVNHAGDILEGASAEHDGVALFGLRGPYAVPAFAAVVGHTDATYADELRTFSRPVKDFTVYTSSDVVAAGPETGVVVLHFVRRRTDVLPSDFVAAWVGGHRDLLAGGGAGGGRLRRCVQNLLVAPAPQGFAFDGIAEYWFDTIDEVKSAADEIIKLLGVADETIEAGGSLLLVADVILAAGPAFP
ncbi:hypothetical protein [Mycolicibacterium hodleri]|uniref:EthD domain-containing protein n=1 Tax=Mycolicibacterium hodleri TaxID=49897 RepID=A0A502DVM0_9MYCO|nr:hypothetical protein [Mycolicibacterium hodleri]TPG29558.1 hypothetical protein EAH80_26395 [Mycolicibacterium hodleri]